MCVSTVCDRERQSRGAATTGKFCLLLSAVQPKLTGWALEHASTREPCLGSWGRMHASTQRLAAGEGCVRPHRGLQLGRMRASTQRLAAGICLPVAILAMEETGGLFSPEQRAKEAEIFLSKGFNFLDDFIPKICRIQIRIPELWQRALQGEEKDRKLSFRECVSSSG